MYCAQYSNSLSYYGNIQYAFFNPQPYIWGAWELPYSQHYQPSLDEHEERVIEEHQGYAAEPIPISFEADNEAILLRMQHEARMNTIAAIKPQPLARNKRKSVNTDDEDMFILM